MSEVSEEFRLWIPHVGRNFEKAQLFLLGESAYSWEDPPKSGNYRVPELRHPQDMVKYVTCNFPKDRFICRRPRSHRTGPPRTDRGARSGRRRRW